MRHLLLLIFCHTTLLFSQSVTFTNPIITGSSPDPSICKVGDTFYLVNSTFEYFPGLPIYQSTDLVNWTLIGHGLHSIEQCNGVVNLLDVQSDGGIHAPTLRYHDGLFYLITTNVYYDEEKDSTSFVNFIITAKNPAGPWSAPHVLAGAPGIDPDLFFDDDGRVWYTGTHAAENPNFQGEGEIWLQEVDLDQWALIGERYYLWRGACGGVWAEGPHLYKRNGYYYLLIAEGGTSFNHAVMVAISDTITGPYVPNDRNPIFTTRHLSYDNWVHSTGHADLIAIDSGQWYMVLLGIRGDVSRGSNMGRETHLIPVQWEKEPFEWKNPRYEWPVVAPNIGKLLRHQPLPLPQVATSQPIKQSCTTDFSDTLLSPLWTFRRVPNLANFSLQDRPGFLRIYSSPQPLANRAASSFIGCRQQESDFTYSANFTLSTQETGTEGGIAIVQKDDQHIRFTMHRNSDSLFVLQIKHVAPETTYQIGADYFLQDAPSAITLRITSTDNQYTYSYGIDDTFTTVATSPADLVISRGYTGTFIGLYTTSNGQPTTSYMDVDWVSCEFYPRP